MLRSLFSASAIILALVAWNGTASAAIESSTIYFSVDSSADPGDPPPANALTANITYTFDSDLNTLTLDFDNLSSGILQELYFSTTDAVTGFTIDSTWLNDGSSSTLQNESIGPHDGTPVDGMGTYDWVLALGQGGDGIDDFGTGIDGTVVMSVDGSGLTLADFFIMEIDGSNYGPAVLKFQSLDEFSEEFNSAFGQGSYDPIVGDPVPEPGTLGLLFMGIAGIASTRMRRRTT